LAFMQKRLDMVRNNNLLLKASHYKHIILLADNLLAFNLKVHKSQKTSPKGFFGFFISKLLIALLAYNIIAYNIISYNRVAHEY